MQCFRTPFKFSESIDRQLNSYALAAAAAGAGLLALVCPAEGKIVYTPTNVCITSDFSLDLNNDNIADFTLATVTTGRSGGFASMYVRPAQSGNLIWGEWFYQLPVASALHPGVNIRASRKLQPFHTFMWAPYLSRKTPWYKVANRYLGLKFDIQGKVHYGWARLTTNKDTCNGQLTGYAYETVVNRPIKTGKTKGPDVITLQPRTLGSLALGTK